MLPFTSPQALAAEATPTRATPTAGEDQVPEGAGFEDALDVAASEDGFELGTEPDVDIVPTTEPAPTPAPLQPPNAVAPGLAVPPATADESPLPVMDTEDGSATDASATNATQVKAPLPSLTLESDRSHATAKPAQTIPAMPSQTMSVAATTMSVAATTTPTAPTADAAASTVVAEATPPSDGGAPSKESVTPSQDTVMRPTTTDLPGSQGQAARPAPVAQTPGTRPVAAPTPSASVETANNANATPESSSQSSSQSHDDGRMERQPAREFAPAQPLDRTREPSTAAPMTAAERTSHSAATEAAVPTTTQTGNNVQAATPTTDAAPVVPSVASPAVTSQPITGAAMTPTQQTRPVEVPDVADILEQVRVRLAPRRPEITVLLDPPELGRLVIKLVMKGGELAATVTADDARVARMFEGDVGRLYRTLDEAGIRVVEVEIRTALDSSADSDNPRDERRAGSGSDDPADAPNSRDVRGTSRSQQDSAQPSRSVAKSRASTLDLMI